MARVALITPAVELRIFGVTVIGTLLPGATVPLFGDIESKVFAFASPVIAQLSGALPGLDRLKDCCAGFFPWIALNVSAFVVSTMAGRSEGPTVRMVGGGLTVTVAAREITFIVTLSLEAYKFPAGRN